MDAHECNLGLHCDFYAGNSDQKAPQSFQRLLSLCCQDPLEEIRRENRRKKGGFKEAQNAALSEAT